ncbi:MULTISPECIES: hypothetical protein [unclassified Pseudomonas]|uniref:hypothetical protein n=1 Tax=Pseudomonas TaxID=286 RepID=UPI00224902D3|nr:hypothetical protein [Pseudomonas sp. DCB_BG]MCX2710182.1 hypothetical protein [Pseudomonas sp. DCB_BG]
MPDSTRTWQLISLALTVALIATLFKLYRRSAAHPTATGTLPSANSATNLEHLALSPNARRVHERYSL